ncbi:uncharacterized protein LOC135951991 isoform X4 [Calliphora vicina]|uniref:uncharacterized protein LOC135951991 isoform X4 n=1 Tax=Calliphora vicina TaxID=7373 RepID=UPI00325B6223
MADSGGRQYQKLPPGWDCKYDQTTGNCYYINYITKAMQLEDPRSRYRPLQNERCSNESIAMHSFHGPGGSPYHVYPTNNMPAIRAFQTPNSSLHHMSTSPLLTSSRTQLINDMSPIPAPKSQYAQAPRTVNMSRRSTIQETSFTNQIDTDAVVNKIQNMFPTASENHIRLLLKKYMKTIFPKADETLLLDVLANADNNVQKASEKLISLGYIKKDFAPPPKLINRPQYDLAEYAKQVTEDEIKIIPLRPKEYTEEEKEAIKRHLKEKYPQIVDHILIMALESVNYAEDRAMQILQIVKDEEDQQKQKTQQSKQTLSTTLECKHHEELDGIGNMTGHVTSRPITSILKTTEATLRKEITINEIPEIFEDKMDTTNYHTNNYDTITPSIRSTLKLSAVTMSTKSILDRYRSNNKISANDFIRGTYPVTTVIWDKLSPHSRDKSDSLKHSHRDHTDATTDKLCKDFKSLMGRIQTNGPNDSLAKGPNEGLLLADYVTWNGANPDFCQGQRNLANGPDSSMLSERAYKSYGHNSDLCKGPQLSLAKGSIYAQQNSANANKSLDIKCN